MKTMITSFTNDEATAFYRPYKKFAPLFFYITKFGRGAVKNDKNLQHCLILGHVPYSKRTITGRLMAVGNCLL